MLLALDVGNTQTKVGLYEGETQLGHSRFGTVRDWSADQWRALLNELLVEMGGRAPIASAVASVVPSAKQPLAEALRSIVAAGRGTADGRTRAGLPNCDPYFVEPGRVSAVRVLYQPAESLGADRLANAVAALALVGGPAVVVDLGTATKFEAVAADGAYLGGAIAPGLQPSASALAQRADKLYEVALELPNSPIATCTDEALQSGILYGFASMVDGMVERFRSELGSEARVIGTGGALHLIRPVCKTIEFVEPNLTLDGVRLLWEKR